MNESLKQSEQYKLQILCENENINEIKILLNTISKENIDELINDNDNWDYTVNWHYNPLKKAIQTKNLKLIELLLKFNFKDMGRFGECGEIIYESALYFCYCDDEDLSKINPNYDLIKLLFKYNAIEKNKHCYNFEDLINYAIEIEIDNRDKNNLYVNNNFDYNKTKENVWNTIKILKKLNIFDIDKLLDKNNYCITNNDYWEKRCNIIKKHLTSSGFGIKTNGIKNINFRSMIEAKWAYIFDKLNLNWEYEPFELKGYIPDFIIIIDDKQILIEIKSDLNIWENKNTDYEHKIKSSGWINDFIILGGNIKKDNEFSYLIGYGYMDNKYSKIFLKKTKNNSIIFSIDNNTYNNNLIDNLDQLWIESKNNYQWKGI